MGQQSGVEMIPCESVYKVTHSFRTETEAYLPNIINGKKAITLEL